MREIFRLRGLWVVMLTLTLLLSGCQTSKNPLTPELRRDLRVETITVVFVEQKKSVWNGGSKWQNIGPALETALKEQLHSLRGRRALKIEIEVTGYFVPTNMATLFSVVGFGLLAGPVISSPYLNTLVTLRDAESGEVLVKRAHLSVRQIHGTFGNDPPLVRAYARKIHKWLLGGSK